MMKVSKIVSAGGFRLRIVFSDGSGGELDFCHMVEEDGPMIAPLRDPVYFAKAFIEDGAVTWPNGFDLAPAWLHRQLASEGDLRFAADA